MVSVYACDWGAGHEFKFWLVLFTILPLMSPVFSPLFRLSLVTAMYKYPIYNAITQVTTDTLNMINRTHGIFWLKNGKTMVKQ